MAGKGGGAWKVAYADFVTAMMAFFLVMWLTAQDQQIKKAVSYYFMDPLGASKRPSRGGGVVQETSTGAVPHADSVAGSHGRTPLSQPSTEPSRITKAVNDFLRADKDAQEQWKTKIQECKDRAATLPDVIQKKRSVDDAAIDELVKELRNDFTADIAKNTKGVHQDLLIATINEVNWRELAEDLMNPR